MILKIIYILNLFQLLFLLLFLYIIHTNISNIIPTIILNAIQSIRTSIPVLINKTSITTIQIIVNTDIYTSDTLIGFSGFKNLDASIQFYIFFEYSVPSIISQGLKFLIYIISDSLVNSL